MKQHLEQDCNNSNIIPNLSTGISMTFPSSTEQQAAVANYTSAYENHSDAGQNQRNNAYTPLQSQVGLQRSRTTMQSGGTRRGTQVTVLDRELIRSEQTYAMMQDDSKWNKKTVKLALQFMSLAEPAIVLSLS